MPVVNASNTYYLIGGTVRKTDGVWGIVDNGTHSNRGIDSPVEDGRSLRVPIRPVTPDCGWGAVTMDGNLNDAGITCGVTAQGDHISITFMRDGVAVSPDDPVFDDPGANIWISWVQIK